MSKAMLCGRCHTVHHVFKRCPCTLVLAGNVGEYADWIHQQGLHLNSPQYTHVDSVLNLYGRRGAKLVVVGTWRTRADLHELRAACMRLGIELPE